MNVPLGGSRLFSVNTQTNKNDYNAALGWVLKENEIWKVRRNADARVKEEERFFVFQREEGSEALCRRLHGMERYWGNDAKQSVLLAF